MPTEPKKFILNSAEELYAELRDKNFNAVGATLSRKAKYITAQFDVSLFTRKMNILIVISLYLLKSTWGRLVFYSIVSSSFTIFICKVISPKQPRRGFNLNGFYCFIGYRFMLPSFRFQERHAAKTVGEIKQFVSKLPHMQAAKTSLATRRYTILTPRLLT